MYEKKDKLNAVSYRLILFILIVLLPTIFLKLLGLNSLGDLYLAFSTIIYLIIFLLKNKEDKMDDEFIELKPIQEGIFEEEIKPKIETRQVPKWITAGFILLLVFISIFAYIFFTNIYYVKNHACVACVEKYNAECYFDGAVYYMEGDILKSQKVLLTPQDINIEPTSEW